MEDVGVSRNPSKDVVSDIVFDDMENDAEITGGYNLHADSSDSRDLMVAYMNALPVPRRVHPSNAIMAQMQADAPRYTAAISAA